jgi:hypothetical protein
MASSFRRLFGKKDLSQKKVYMAQPSVLYHTRTERICKDYLKDYFEAHSICTPLDFRKKDRTFFEQLMVESNAVVGVTIEDVYTYPVWNDLEYAQTMKKPYFTLQVVKTGRDLDLFLLEGMIDLEKLSWEETKAFYMEIQKKQVGVSFLLPKRPQY